MSALKKWMAENLYIMEGNSAWIFADGADIWIVKGEFGVSISVWSKDISEDPVDSIVLERNKFKGEAK